MIERLRSGDAAEVAEMIRRTVRITNAKDYSADFLEKFLSDMSAAEVLRRAEAAHIYVAREDGRVIGCGAVSPSEDERPGEIELTMLYVLPEWQGAGVGRAIMEALERDELCLTARWIELSASITAVDFYKRMGYAFKDGTALLNETLGFPMEKLLQGGRSNGGRTQ